MELFPQGLAPCAACLPRPVCGPVTPACDALMGGPLPALGDPEGASLPAGLPPVIDAHVHLFPDGVSEALWRWFDRYGWPVRYRLPAPEVGSFLRRRGVRRMVGLAYSHRPGMARVLNAFMAERCAADPAVIGLGTVLPGEPDAAAVVQEAFTLGLRGLKLHCHVQGFAPDDPRLTPIYEACARWGRPLVMHAGREPRSPHTAVDPHDVCGVARVDAVLREHPGLTLVVPHLGADEFEPYARLLERHDHLWLDTTMMLADYFAVPSPAVWLMARPERILFGTDFPNLPYAWDREVRHLAALRLGDDQLAGILGGNAARLYDLAPGWDR